ncbi:Halomucin [Frankliniella fusca]|uniref:Halomucin n=1 Tax=Frankliniella fusca TaxID=407009 RepID=A0AAE1I3H1_9NEOP|nr:Halomucin [Frankliniella fusca]
MPSQLILTTIVKFVFRRKSSARSRKEVEHNLLVLSRVQRVQTLLKAKLLKIVHKTRDQYMNNSGCPSQENNLNREGEDVPDNNGPSDPSNSSSSESDDSGEAGGPNGDCDHSDESGSDSSGESEPSNGGESDISGSINNSDGTNSDDPDPSDDDGVNLIDNDIGRNQYVLEFLKNWSLYGVTAVKVDELLSGLKRMFPILPKTTRTLLNTPSTSNIEQMGSGLFWYKGIQASLVQRLTPEYVQTHHEIQIDIGIDGVQLFKAAFDEFYPILGSLKDSDGEPFIIGVWCGKGSPPLEDFLDKFHLEIIQYQEAGLNYNGRMYPFRIRHFICDALARQLVKSITSHNDFHGCEKCTVRGIRYRQRTVFLNLDAALRSDNDFLNRRDELHHTGDIEVATPLERANIRMVSMFRLDPLHLVDIGVFKRWMKFLLGKYKGFPAKISGVEQLHISQAMVENIAPYIPKEFSRHLRPLSYFVKYTATEFRRMLRYDGLVIFRDLHPDIYYNYLLLFCGIYIFSDHELIGRLGNVGNQCLRRFIAHATQVISPAFVVYNVHNLVHIFDECTNHGTLDEISSYKYENYLGVMKRYLRSSYLPLQQLYKRDQERHGRLIRNKKSIADDEIILSGPHNDWNVEEQYSKLEVQGYTLARDQRNNCYLTVSGDICALFAVIEWPNGGVDIVPTKWLNNAQNTVKYPEKGVAPPQLVRSLAAAKSDWASKPIIFHHSYDSFASARKASKILERDGEVGSNVETDYSQPRIRKKNKRYATTESDEEADEDGSTLMLKKGCKKTAKQKKEDKNESEVREQVAKLVRQANLSKSVKSLSDKKSQPKVVKVVKTKSKKGPASSNSSPVLNSSCADLPSQFVTSSNTMLKQMVVKITPKNGPATSNSSPVLNLSYADLQSQLESSSNQMSKPMMVQITPKKGPVTSNSSVVPNAFADLNQLESSSTQISKPMMMKISQQNASAASDALQTQLVCSTASSEGRAPPNLGTVIYSSCTDLQRSLECSTNQILSNPMVKIISQDGLAISNNSVPNSSNADLLSQLQNNCVEQLNVPTSTPSMSPFMEETLDLNGIEDQLQVSDSENFVESQNKDSCETVFDNETGDLASSGGTNSPEQGSKISKKILKSKKKKSEKTSKNQFILALNIAQENSHKIDELKGMLRRIINKLFPEEATVRRPPNCPKLPLSNHEQLGQFEIYLDDDENFGEMVHHLFGKVKHTTNEHDCVYRALETLFEPKLCASISWKVTRGKKFPFFNTKCVELIQCLATKIWDEATDLNEVTSCIKRYFVISVNKSRKQTSEQEDSSGNNSNEGSDQDSDGDSEGQSEEDSGDSTDN